MIAAAYRAGVDVACRCYGVKTAAIWDQEEKKPSLLRRALPYLAAAGATLGGYKMLRRFSPSKFPELAGLQRKAQGKSFELATGEPLESRLSEALYGVKKIPPKAPLPGDKPIPSWAPSFAADKPGAVVLHNIPGDTDVVGGVNINKGRLVNTLDDKYTFHTEMSKEMSGDRFPYTYGETHLPKAMRKYLSQRMKPRALPSV